MQRVYVMTWVGNMIDQGDACESGRELRGGGWGKTRDIVVGNLELDGTQDKPVINQDNGVQNSGYEGTSKMVFSHLYLRDFTGTLMDSGLAANLPSREIWPCHHIYGESGKVGWDL